MLRQIVTHTAVRGRAAAHLMQNGAVRRISCSPQCCRSGVELTSVRYPGVRRGSYAHLSDKHVQHFQSILPKERIITDADDVAGYNVDWLGMVRGWYSHCCLLSLHSWLTDFDDKEESCQDEIQTEDSSEMFVHN
jgi:hypothetical protein